MYTYVEFLYAEAQLVRLRQNTEFKCDRHRQTDRQTQDQNSTNQYHRAGVALVNTNSHAAYGWIMDFNALVRTHTFHNPLCNRVTVPPKWPFPWRGRGPSPHLTHGSFGPPDSKPQTASRSVHPFEHNQKVKVASCMDSITERRVPELIPVLGSQPAGDVSHKPGGRLPLLSTRPAVTPRNS